MSLIHNSATPVSKPVKFNLAAEMINEDHMKKLMSLTTTEKWKFSNNKMLPKS